MSTLGHAICIAAEAHQGTFDRSGQPYVLHPLRVMLAMASDEARMAAVLHDVVEDTDWTLERLGEEGFAAPVVRAVDAVTRREGEDYFEFCARAARDPIGRAVKEADLLDNLDTSRLDEVTPKDLDRLERYRRALEIVRSASSR